MLEKIKQLIEQNLVTQKVMVIDLTGTQDHLGLTVVSDAFLQKSLLEQHRMIMDILSQEFKEKLHAVKIETFTQDQYLKKFGQL